jgi:hypothetical protein
MQNIQEWTSLSFSRKEFRSCIPPVEMLIAQAVFTEVGAPGIWYSHCIAVCCEEEPANPYERI